MNPANSRGRTRISHADPDVAYKYRGIWNDDENQVNLHRITADTISDSSEPTMTKLDLTELVALITAAQFAGCAIGILLMSGILLLR